MLIASGTAPEGTRLRDSKFSTDRSDDTTGRTKLADWTVGLDDTTVRQSNVGTAESSRSEGSKPESMEAEKSAGSSVAKKGTQAGERREEKRGGKRQEKLCIDQTAVM